MVAPNETGVATSRSAASSSGVKSPSGPTKTEGVQEVGRPKRLDFRSASSIGGAGGSEAYRALLLGNAFVYAARNVLFTDFVDDANLRACYASASAFVCMSDHEGFCAPLLEAMAWHVPVFAWDAGAVSETLDGAGVLFARGTPGEVMAETIGRVLGDSALRAAVIRRQDERLARFRARDQWKELRTMLGLPDASGGGVA